MKHMIFRKRNRAEQNEKNYQNWLKQYIPTTTNQKIELIRVFTDRSGNNFYILKNPAHLTRERSQRIEESLLAIEFGVSKEEIENKLNGLLDEIKEFPWQNMTRDKLRQFVEQSQNDIGDLLYRMKRIKLDDMLLQAGLYFFYIDGENPYIINEETQQRKLDCIKQDDELRSFFLNSIEEILKGSTGIKG